MAENKAYLNRPSWDDYFMEIAAVAAKRTTCMRRSVGAVMVLDRHILATGYNGAPSGTEHCSATGCLRDQLGVPSGERAELCRGLHAEQNAIIQAALHGTSTRGATIYTTLCPCSICAKMLINAGVARIVYQEGYPEDLGRSMLEESGVELVKSPEKGVSD